MNDHRAYIDSLPPLRITRNDFKHLPEYSASMPTGTTPGKVWRRLDGDFDLDWKQQGGQPRWMIGQYDPKCPEDAKTIKILWFRPIITLKADVPSVRMKADMFVPTFDEDQAWLRPDIEEWLKERAIKVRHLGLSRIEFYRRDDAMEFKMRWC